MKPVELAELVLQKALPSEMFARVLETPSLLSVALQPIYNEIYLNITRLISPNESFSPGSRNSSLEVFCKKGVCTIFTEFTGKQR